MDSTILPALNPTSALIIATILLALLYFSSHILTAENWAHNVPQAPQEPLYSRLLQEPSHDALRKWAETIPNSGLLLYRGLYKKPKILLTNTAAAQEVHQKRNQENGSGYKYEKESVVRKSLASLLGEGLVTAAGEEHKVQRKLLQPVFKLRNVKNQYPLFWSKTRELVAALQESASQDSSGKVELTGLVNRATLDIIGQAGFGLDFDCLANPNNELWEEYAAAFRGAGNGSQHTGLLWSTLARFLPRRVVEMLLSRRNEQTKKAVGAVRRRIGNVIARKKNDAERLTNARKDSVVIYDAKEQQSELLDANEEDVNNNNDIISQCIRSGITDFEMLLEQSLAILGAGHETIAQTLCVAIFELSKNKPLQDRLRAEIYDKLPWISQSREEQSPTESELDSIETLQLLNAVCNETLRMYPIIPSLVREAACDVELLGHRIPKGTVIMTILPIFNRNPALWDQDTSLFNPDRWLVSANGGAKKRSAFMTFGHGPSACIGEKMARSEMAILLAGLVAAFEVEFFGQGVDGKEKREELEFEWGVVYMIKGGLWMRLKPVGLECEN
ncbi:unnamed protein product [Cercospora beticola]|nr:unnamed protein product [Cercospora beticola]